MVIWFIGLSGAGKSTLGREVARQWRMKEPNTVLLDGDELRAVFAQDRSDADYTLAGRQLNAQRLTSLCEMLDRQGINVVCCVLSVFTQLRSENRTRFSRYFEVLLDAPLSVLRQRDTKGLYEAAAKGQQKNVVGVDIPFERPQGCDLVVDSSGVLENLETLASDVLRLARNQ